MSDRGRNRWTPAEFAIVCACVFTFAWAPISAARVDFPAVAARLAEAWSYCAYGLSELARPIFSDVARDDPAEVEAILALGLISDAGGRSEAAVRQYEEAARIGPTTMEAALLTLQGDVLLRSGKPDEASYRYEAALGRDGALARAHYGLGVATETLGRVGGAWPQSVAGRVDVPKEGSPNSNRDWRSKAIDEQQAALELAPDLTDAHVRLARLLIESAGERPDASSDELREALDHLVRARALDERNPEIHLLMGRAYASTGQEAESRHAYRRAEQLLALGAGTTTAGPNSGDASP